MAQVLWYATNSGLRNVSCLKEISAVKELLVKMLEEISQVSCVKLYGRCEMKQQQILQ